MTGKSPSPKTHPIDVTGNRQSPIDIKSQDFIQVSNRQPIYLDYPESVSDLLLKNSGYGWVVNVPKEVGKNCSIEQGPLEGKYVLEQFHAHWGPDCSCGSEHTIDGKTFAAELHLVHWNSSRFSTFSEAVSNDKGLAVLGIFLEVGPEPHPQFDKLCRQMMDIKYKDDSIKLNNSMDLHEFLPQDKGYWSYEGSLTTPPFFESVTWIVFKEPMKVSEEQLESFRSLCNHAKDENPGEEERRIVTNFRTPQALCNRTITFDRNTS